MKQDTFKNH